MASGVVAPSVVLLLNSSSNSSSSILPLYKAYDAAASDAAYGGESLHECGVCRTH